MPRKLPDSRNRSSWKRLTEREYGGKAAANGGRNPTTQDTGRTFGRGSGRRARQPGRQGPRF